MLEHPGFSIAAWAVAFAVVALSGRFVLRGFRGPRFSCYRCGERARSRRTRPLEHPWTRDDQLSYTCPSIDCLEEFDYSYRVPLFVVALRVTYYGTMGLLWGILKVVLTLLGSGSGRRSMEEDGTAWDSSFETTNSWRPRGGRQEPSSSGSSRSVGPKQEGTMGGGSSGGGGGGSSW
jgi:uncharacterized membrane protein YgcG